MNTQTSLAEKIEDIKFLLSVGCPLDDISRRVGYSSHQNMLKSVHRKDPELVKKLYKMEEDAGWILRVCGCGQKKKASRDRVEARRRRPTPS